MLRPAHTFLSYGARVTAQLRTDHATGLHKFLGRAVTVAGAIGLGGGQAISPHDQLCALSYVRLPDALCALTLATNGVLQLWHVESTAQNLVEGRAAGAGVSNSALLATVELMRCTAAAVATSTERLSGCELGVWVSAPAAPIGVAVALGGVVHATSVVAGSAAELATQLADAGRNWVRLGPPGAPGGGGEALKPILKLAIAPTSAAGDTLAVYALLSSGLPSLWRAPIGVAAMWSRLPIDANVEANLALDDLTTVEQPTAAPLATLTDFYLQRLLRPARFASRHVAAVQRALLPSASPASFATCTPAQPPAVAATIRAGMQSRCVELAPSSVFSHVEQALGDSLLSCARSQKVEAHEIVGLGALALVANPNLATGASPPTPIACVLTRSQLLLLQPPLTTPDSRTPTVPLLLSAAAAHGDAVFNLLPVLPPLTHDKWIRSVLHAATAPSTHRQRHSPERSSVLPQVKALDTGYLAATSANGMVGVPPIVRRLGSNGLANAVQQLLALIAAPSHTEGCWDARCWHAELTARWQERVSEAPSSNVPSHGLAFYLTAAVHSTSTRAAAVCRDALLLLVAAVRMYPSQDPSETEAATCEASAAALLPALSYASAACELLSCLVTDVSPNSSAFNASALKQLLLSAALSIPPCQPMTDTAACTRALLAFVLCDVGLAKAATSSTTLAAPPNSSAARAVGSLLEASTVTWPGSMSALWSWSPCSFLRKLANGMPLREEL